MRSVLTLRPKVHALPLIYMFGPSVVRSWSRRNDPAGDRRRRDGCGRGDIGLRLGTAEASLEVAAGIGDCVFSRCQHALVASRARAAARYPDGGSGLDHDVDKAFVYRLEVSFAGTGIDHHARVRGELLALHDGGGHSEVIDAAAGTGAENCFVNSHLEKISGVAHVREVVWDRDQRLDFRNVEVDDATI